MSSNLSDSESSSKKQEVMAAVRQEIQMANAQELMNKMNERCFDRCVTKPGAKLENGEQVCISRCMERYMEAWNVVARAYTQDFQRIMKETEN